MAHAPRTHYTSLQHPRSPGEEEGLMEDKSVAVDEARRVGEHEAVKSHVEHEVGEEITDRADRGRRADAARIEHVAGDFREKAIDEVVEKDRDVDRGRGLARGSQVVDYVFYLIYGLL